MLDEESKQRVKELCDQIAKERDHNRFSLLISELNRILEASRAATDVAGNRDGSVRKDGSRNISPANKQLS